MNRPPLEVADIVRCAGQSFLERSQRWINWQHQKVLLAITRCRTAALGGHRDRCSGCGHTAISYNSCRNRHCPKCQGNARLRWLQAREQELLPIPYVHVVFTLPRELAPYLEPAIAASSPYSLCACCQWTRSRPLPLDLLPPLLLSSRQGAPSCLPR